MTDATDAELIARLREVTEDDAYQNPWTFGENCREAADRFEALAARVAELEAALRPFADIGIGTDPDYEPMIRMDRAAIVAARAALAKP